MADLRVNYCVAPEGKPLAIMWYDRGTYVSLPITEEEAAILIDALAQKLDSLRKSAQENQARTDTKS